MDSMLSCLNLSFFFNDPATSEIYTLSLHDALPISSMPTSPAIARPRRPSFSTSCTVSLASPCSSRDRKSTRLNSSHSQISYAVFCLKKKNRSSRRLSRHHSARPDALSDQADHIALG